MFNSVMLKIGKMRKAQDFTVGFANGKQTVTFQSDKCIGSIDVATRVVRFTNKGCYFPHLAFAENVEFPADMIDTIIKAADSKAHLGDGTYMLLG